MAPSKQQHSHIYVQRNDDPRLRQRTVPMEVLSLGYSRTGTMTMKAALEILGIPTWHWISMAENPPDLDFWAEVLEAKWDPSTRAKTGIEAFDKALFDKLLGHWGALADQPGVLFSEELVKAYPEAKVVLVEREIESWFRSYSKTVIAGAANWFIPLASHVDPSFLGQMSRQTDLISQYYFNVPEARTTWALINNPAYFEAWRQNSRAFYLAHNEKVRRVTPPERLLVFRVEDGWQPLCQFIGKPIPDIPFPRVNEAEAVAEKIKLYIAESYRRTAIRFAKRALPVFVVAAAIWLWAIFG